ncbi:hypothetical protein CONPUDRAFT_87266 [Coniophora puteana RWD-64-598 SS2]|uniref:RRM domain-containing protein n=1 Tax=Coniophora puteana (strain RWD-64-598) TaxID=741705 RepID=A0A5M3N097_CONPW|nr:uncharacterized protein CONPUDRAFT_87266 [Coniophora puteana RWD-64-598 SS2]EIW84677.1 hypothetical protein CONPUDRAFT_87266 [Coniophora puteana RWD-64-598 SS2]
MSSVKSVGGFSAVPIAYSSSTHYLYLRKNTTSKAKRTDELPDGRTLFLVNVPVDATEREIVLFFKPCGTVERVVFNQDSPEEQLIAESDSEGDGDGDEMDDVQEGEELEEDEEEGPSEKRRKRRRFNKDSAAPPSVVSLPSPSLRILRRTGGTAHVVFLDPPSLDRLTSTSKPRPWPRSEEPSGLAHYRALYTSLRPPLDAVRTHADSFMTLFEYNLAKAKQKSKYRKGEAIVDEDGFTLVTRGGAYGTTLGGGVGVASKQFEKEGRTASRKKKEPKEKVAFYAFQKAEKQRKAIMDLKKNFEQDKARIAKLRESRKFKPY